MSTASRAWSRIELSEDNSEDARAVIEVNIEWLSANPEADKEELDHTKSEIEELMSSVSCGATGGSSGCGDDCKFGIFLYYRDFFICTTCDGPP